MNYKKSIRNYVHQRLLNEKRWTGCHVVRTEEEIQRGHYRVDSWENTKRPTEEIIRGRRESRRMQDTW